MTATTTTNMGLVKPALIDAAAIGILNGNMDLLDVHDHSTTLLGPAVKRIQYGAMANRPIFGNPGHIYFTIDTHRLFFDDGTSWSEFANQAFPSGFAVTGGTADFSVGGVVLKVPAVITAAAGGILTLPVATDTIVSRTATEPLSNKTLINPRVTGQVYRGTATQTLEAITAANTGLWRFFKAYGGTLIINGPSSTMINPGATSTASTYSSPNGESTGWYQDATHWVCI